MFITVEAHEYARNSCLLDQMFTLRKTVFADRLKWNVPVTGDQERDAYDEMKPAYLIWCNDDRTVLYGSIRLMPTTGPTLLYDVFRKTFPSGVDLMAPGIWEGTRMCIDAGRLAEDHPDIDAARAMCLLLLALCECAMAHGIHTMISNYEPHTERLYRRAGAEVEKLGSCADYGRLPVCCGAFEVSDRVLSNMRAALKVAAPLYHKHRPRQSVSTDLQRQVA